MSPEIFSNQPYGQKSDVWALGCCVYEMATLEHAFTAGDISSLVLKIIRGHTPTPPSVNVYSAQLIELINAMLDKDAENRPTVKQLLQHPYIKEHINQLYEKTKQRCEQRTKTSTYGKTIRVLECFNLLSRERVADEIDTRQNTAINRNAFSCAKNAVFLSV